MEIKSAEFVKGIIGSNEILNDDKMQIAFIGRSNVGKSSVINSLLNRKNLVKSSSTPGKTKEINFFSVNDSVYFVDLPGYGYAKTSQKIREKLRKLILWYLTSGEVKNKKVILIIDGKVGLSDFDKQMLVLLTERDGDVILVANKMDKVKSSELIKRTKELQNEAGNNDILLYSAKTKLGRDALLQKIFK